jgi:hypothetical protein
MQRRTATVIALLVAVAACGGDDEDEPQAATAPSAPTVPATNAATSTNPATEPPTTSAAPTAEPTAPPTTESVSTTSRATAPPTTEAPSGGWVVSNFVPAASLQGYSGNWAGDSGPSPAAPAEGEMPADGFYVGTVLAPWSPEQPDHLSVRIQRLEWCTELPDGCEYMEPEEMNLDLSWQLDVEVPLDTTTNVVVQGFLCWDGPEQKQATGHELMELFEAYTADYESVIAPRLGEPTADFDVMTEVAAAPEGGFVGEEELCPGGMAGPLRYVHDDAPVLLLQTVTDWERGPLDATDLVRLSGVQYTDGVPLFYFYAGFYS